MSTDDDTQVGGTENINQADLDNLEDENGEPVVDSQEQVDDIREVLDIPDGKEESDLNNPLLQDQTEEQQILSHALQDDHNEG